MQRGFPLSLLSSVCCARDRAPLRPAPGSPDSWLVDAEVRCTACGQGYPVRGGVLSLLDQQQLHPESALEKQVRDTRSRALLEGSRHEWQSRFAEATEVQPTLDAVGVAPGMTLCELGCGPGRYTLALAKRAAAVVAVDFSGEGLQVLRAKLDAEAPVALVQADVTLPYGAPAAFDRLLSTLHSNLPDRPHRAQALRWMADTLRDGGRAVVSMHHFSTREALAGTTASGRYPDSGIYRYYMTRRQSCEELAPWFAEVRHRYIVAAVPGLPMVGVARAAARVPGVREALSQLLLAVVAQPIRATGGVV